MSQMTKEQVATLTEAIENLTYELQQHTDAMNWIGEILNRTDDFNNWTLQDSVASIANSFYKYTAILNNQKNVK